MQNITITKRNSVNVRPQTRSTFKMLYWTTRQLPRNHRSGPVFHEAQAPQSPVWTLVAPS